MTRLELLAPAKNLQQGMAALSHGADAVYMGAPLFGARAAAGNSLQDMERLARYAHLYRAKVYATVNTVLFDNELPQAEAMIERLCQAGVDALIVQDVGLLRLHLPPMELHASTQMHNLDPQRVRFLQQAGFARIILPRELSLQQIREMRQTTTAQLEAFVQGALCVCYSGQCYMSLCLTGGSGNRGTCSQPCRSSYDLCNEAGETLLRNQHLLSLKDFSAARHLREMARAGVTSFKIEGRLKDLAYVKNVTAYYRQLLDSMMQGSQEWLPASSGKCTFHFRPDLERTFNRGFTDYFLQGRQPMASFATQKSMGKRIGVVQAVAGGAVRVDTRETLAPGDGLCYFGADGTLKGMLVNQVRGNTFVPNHLDSDVRPGIPLWRNSDFLFEKQLQGHTADRRIGVRMALEETPDGLRLTVRDEEGNASTAIAPCERQLARDAHAAHQHIERQLGKLGDTPFALSSLRLPPTPLFLPASLLNALRREAAQGLAERRMAAYGPARPAAPCDPPSPRYPYPTVDYRANVTNQAAEDFYKHHGTSVLQRGLDQTHDYAGKALMTSKYCLRYELGQCLRLKNNASVAPPYRGPLLLRNRQHVFALRFDCERCEMQVLLEEVHKDRHQQEKDGE